MGRLLQKGLFLTLYSKHYKHKQMQLSQINRSTAPPLPEIIVTAKPFGKNGRWITITCPGCGNQHIHGDLKNGIWSRREPPCSALAYWIHNPSPTNQNEQNDH